MDEDMKKLIADTYFKVSLPIDTIHNKTKRRKVETFRNNLAVDYYNLTDKPSKLKAFIDNYLFFKSELPDRITKSIDREGYVRRLVESDQGMFRAIVDKIRNDESLTEKEQNHISENLLGGVREIEYNGEQRSSFLAPVGFDMPKKMIYEFVILLSSEEIEVKKCNALGCNKIFLPTGRGFKKLYCSTACRVKEFRREKK